MLRPGPPRSLSGLRPQSSQRLGKKKETTIGVPGVSMTLKKWGQNSGVMPRGDPWDPFMAHSPMARLSMAPSRPGPRRGASAPPPCWRSSTWPDFTKVRRGSEGRRATRRDGPMGQGRSKRNLAPPKATKKKRESKRSGWMAGWAKQTPSSKSRGMAGSHQEYNPGGEGVANLILSGKSTP